MNDNPGKNSGGDGDDLLAGMMSDLEGLSEEDLKAFNLDPTLLRGGNTNGEDALEKEMLSELEDLALTEAEGPSAPTLSDVRGGGGIPARDKSRVSVKGIVPKPEKKKKKKSSDTLRVVKPEDVPPPPVSKKASGSASSSTLDALGLLDESEVNSTEEVDSAYWVPDGESAAPSVALEKKSKKSTDKLKPARDKDTGKLEKKRKETTKLIENKKAEVLDKEARAKSGRQKSKKQQRVIKAEVDSGEYRLPPKNAGLNTREVKISKSLRELAKLEGDEASLFDDEFLDQSDDLILRKVDLEAKGLDASDTLAPGTILFEDLQSGKADIDVDEFEFDGDAIEKDVEDEKDEEDSGESDGNLEDAPAEDERIELDAAEVDFEVKSKWAGEDDEETSDDSDGENLPTIDFSGIAQAKPIAGVQKAIHDLNDLRLDHEFKDAEEEVDIHTALGIENTSAEEDRSASSPSQDDDVSLDIGEDAGFSLDIPDEDEAPKPRAVAKSAPKWEEDLVLDDSADEGDLVEAPEPVIEDEVENVPAPAEMNVNARKRANEHNVESDASLDGFEFSFDGEEIETSPADLTLDAFENVFAEADVDVEMDDALLDVPPPVDESALRDLPPPVGEDADSADDDDDDFDDIEIEDEESIDVQNFIDSKAHPKKDSPRNGPSAAITKHQSTKELPKVQKSERSAGLERLRASPPPKVAQREQFLAPSRSDLDESAFGAPEQVPSNLLGATRANYSRMSDRVFVGSERRLGLKLPAPRPKYGNLAGGLSVGYIGATVCPRNESLMSAEDLEQERAAEQFAKHPKHHREFAEKVSDLLTTTDAGKTVTVREFIDIGLDEIIPRDHGPKETEAAPLMDPRNPNEIRVLKRKSKPKPIAAEKVEEEEFRRGILNRAAKLAFEWIQSQRDSRPTPALLFDNEIFRIIAVRS
ncbi:MAG: hypothetical protein NUW37_02560 [Planctomycetes bacterium]|nr:hypothetical protein [Planctomycetota bacterium]